MEGQDWHQGTVKVPGNENRGRRPRETRNCEPPWSNLPEGLSFPKTRIFPVCIIASLPDIVNQIKTRFITSSQFRIIRNFQNKNGLKLLILKDSYANPMFQFIANHFSETRIIDLQYFKNMKIDYSKGSVQEYVRAHDIDVVLYIYNINSIFDKAFINFNNITTLRI